MGRLTQLMSTTISATCSGQWAHLRLSQTSLLGLFQDHCISLQSVTAD